MKELSKVPLGIIIFAAAAALIVVGIPVLYFVLFAQML